ncbi:hypothetical protein DXG01_014692 [Tephrocybe rancida]|nr:hypothetical protein DXG01_014692 [Tephrocybe rancida]
MRTRGLAHGIVNVFKGLGMGLGGPFGGLLTDWLGWRWAFLIQLPMFMISFALMSHFHHYVTPGKGKSTKEVLKRIDYGGTLILLISVAAALVFLSVKYNESLPWSNPSVIASITVTAVSFIAFLLVELYVAQEPVLAPALLKQKIPVLVGISNFLVATCNYSVNYFYPMWFQIVMSTSASTAGMHLVPNSISMSLGSVFAGYMMHRMGKYKMINLTFGWFPFIGASLVASLRKDSPAFHSWMGIVPLGFGNSVVMQTMLIALLLHLPGQVGGVAVSAAIFQSKLDTELRRRITGPDANEMIIKIRHSSQLVATLPEDLQIIVRDSYEISLRGVFIFSAASTLLAFLVRAPIPDRNLDERQKSVEDVAPPPSSMPRDLEATEEAGGVVEDVQPPRSRHRPRLSMSQPADGGIDPASERDGSRSQTPQQAEQ